MALTDVTLMLRVMIKTCLNITGDNLGDVDYIMVYFPFSFRYTYPTTLFWNWNSVNLFITQRNSQLQKPIRYEFVRYLEVLTTTTTDMVVDICRLKILLHTRHPKSKSVD